MIGAGQGQTRSIACWAIQTQAEPLLADTHLAVQLAVPRLAVLAYSFATNVYFMLAVGVFVRRPGTLNRIWRWRLVIDLLLSLSLAAAPYSLWLWERLTGRRCASSVEKLLWVHRPPPVRYCDNLSKECGQREDLFKTVF